MKMLNDIIFNPTLATILFYLVPALTIGATIFLYVLHMKLVKAGHPKALKWLVEPIPIRPFIKSRRFQSPLDGSSGTSDAPVHDGKSKIAYVFKQLGFRIVFFVILAAIIFTAAIQSILFHECGHGFVSEIVGGIWIQVNIGIFTGLSFSHLPYPPTDWTTYYWAWSWIYAGGFLISSIVGIAFLLFLLIPQIRRSFYASLFCFANGIVSLTYGAEGWYGESWNVLYGHPLSYSDLTGLLQFQGYLNTGLSPQIILDWMIGLLITIQTIMMLVGMKLWRIHYPNHRFSQFWFLVVIELVWWYFLISAVIYN